MSIVRWPRHVRKRCEGCEQCREDGYGGGHYGGDCLLDVLFACRVCGGAEGSLPRDCPGERMHEIVECGVMSGDVDYDAREGWIQVPRRKINNGGGQRDAD